MSRKEAEAMVLHVPGWAIADGQDGVLMISKRLRAKNFVKALEICQRYGAVAEEEGHHPDLHVTGWNMLRVDISTHAAGGLTENDFILAAKFDEVDLADLLSKKQPAGLTD
ncbi:unnamed protein product [Pedinophyceae sp. YPF-701]|nr:unnamed protein product [Pedinophyceae sp. YPF-701]